MATALAEQMAMPDIDELAFEERLGLLVDREATERENRLLTSRLRRAKLKHNAALEDIDYRHPRGLDKSLIPHYRMLARFHAGLLRELICSVMHCPAMVLYQSSLTGAG